ncbi:Bug family tripartite tricarboxylate transporter substrate binding protein [Zhihengliuella halotolerans]|uniref:Bug family tripartite tricarboxylate transporter substrate binding protein n=1 Tax=Zhihengliuella halotolerans TaxID=370736 RepID=UPI000C8036FC|nr:tripartite tricarboxylate transporter substrate-binding protein [Zhihengliuella halotolerans]
MSKQNMKYAVFGVVVAAATVAALVSAAGSGGESTVRSKMVLMAPASPGGGWDGFAREALQAIKSDGISNNVQVVNVPGAGGTIGLGQFAQMEGRSDMLMVTGGVMIGAIELANSQTTLDDVEPIARLADDYAVIVVPGDSEVETLEDFVDAWKQNPGGTAIAGGSLGGIDHLLMGMAAEEVGIDPKDVNYIPYSGGGEAITSVMSGTTAAAVSGYNELSDQIEKGTLRALAISSDERLPGVDVPTFKEAGVDAAMANWRGYVAAPGITEEEKAELVAIITEFHATEHWQDAVKRNNWTDSFMVGEEFDAFLAEEIVTTQELVEGLGL